MYDIKNVSDDTHQTRTYALDDGSSFTMILYYIPLQYMWVIKKLTHDKFVLNNHRIVDSNNILHQFRNQIPFGLACLSENKIDPSLIDDFSSEKSKLYILTEAELDTYAEHLENG